MYYTIVCIQCTIHAFENKMCKISAKIVPSSWFAFEKIVWFVKYNVRIRNRLTTSLPLYSVDILFWITLFIFFRNTRISSRGTYVSTYKWPTSTSVPSKWSTGCKILYQIILFHLQVKQLSNKCESLLKLYVGVFNWNEVTFLEVKQQKKIMGCF